MPLTRAFLGWDRPPGETVPAWLLRGSVAGLCDRRGTVVVTPTRQSSWRLRAALPLAAQERHGAALLGLDVVTAPVLLEPPPRAGRASELQSLLAWCVVLKDAPAGDLDAFLGRQRPGNAGWALQVARRLIGLRRELADGALSIADVAALGAELDECDRWQAMAELERRYLTKLAAQGLSDSVSDQLDHARSGRLAAAVRRVVLAAMPDPPRLLVSLLQRWSDGGATVDVLVAAPETVAASFDEWGRPLPDAWLQSPIPLDDRDIVLAANPDDQAARVARLLRDGMAERPAGDDRLRPAVAIGVPDRETVAPLQREMAAIGLPAFNPGNRRFADTPLAHLVDALLAWRERNGYAETAGLLRHPDVLMALAQPDDVLRELDEVQTRRLPVTFGELREAADLPNLSAALARMADWLGRLDAGSLASGLRGVLQDVYRERLLAAGEPRDNAFQQAAAALDAALQELAAAEAAAPGGDADRAAALRARLQDATVKPERAGERLDLEGWLELGWNPAPLLIVTGMNEGLVPDSRIGDLFLPDALRRRLDLRDDRRRVARDAYLLTALCGQRADRGDGPAGPRTILLVGKRTAGGDPLRPSRLLFRCPDDALVRRAHVLFADPPPVHAAAAFAVSFKLDPARLPADAIDRTRAARIRATAFRDYLACPLRFYLQHVLGAESVDDRSREPDAGAFGDLCHTVLDDMARDGRRIWSCGNAERLAAWLEQRLRGLAVRRYGSRPWLGVTLAVESAVRRLRAFAAEQVKWHAQGWKIVESETDRAALSLAGAEVSCRIDRIDRGPGGRYCVLDYKTSDKGLEPEETHLAPAGPDEPLAEAVVPEDVLATLSGDGRRRTARARRWIDLQLPLYRELLRGTHGPDVGLGYVVLPAALGKTAFATWDGYNDRLHEQAMACARTVVERIRKGVFWPPSGRPPPSEAFEDLLLGNAQATIERPCDPWTAAAAAAGEAGR